MDSSLQPANFTEAARQFARGKPITLIDGHRLLQWLGGSYTAETTAEKQKPAGEAVDPYEILGVPRNATEDQIRTSYKRMMAMYHPDKVAHLGPELQEVAQLKARELNRAYELLMNQVSENRAG
jgi:preprotein translocase subunit Sec63